MKWLIRHRTLPRLVLDVTGFVAAFYVFYLLRFKAHLVENPVDISQIATISIVLTLLGVLLALYWLVVYGLSGLYRPTVSTSRYEAVADTLRASVIGTVILFILVTMFIPLEATRFLIFIYGGLVFLFTAGLRVLFRTLLQQLFRRRIGLYTTTLVGYGKRGRKLYSTLSASPGFGYTITTIAVLSDRDHTDIPEDVRCIPIENLETVLNPDCDNPAEFVLLSLEPTQRKVLLDIIDRVSRYPAKMLITPDFFQMLVGLARSQQVYGMPMIEVFPELMTPLHKVVKRAMDIAAGLTILTIGLPVLILVGLGVKLTSRGPMLYSQKRVGLHGKEFTIYKFRSMVPDAEKKTGAVFAQENDPRITRFGRFIRRTRLDELPQAWSVLKGDMSLVGPRPERKVFVEELKKQIPFYSRLFNVKPGLTSLGQVNHGYAGSIEEIRERVQYELFYLQNISIGLDIRILLHTVWVVLKMEGR